MSQCPTLSTSSITISLYSSGSEMMIRVIVMGCGLWDDYLFYFNLVKLIRRSFLLFESSRSGVTGWRFLLFIEWRKKNNSTPSIFPASIGNFEMAVSNILRFLFFLDQQRWLSLLIHNLFLSFSERIMDNINFRTAMEIKTCAGRKNVTIFINETNWYFQ